MNVEPLLGPLALTHEPQQETSGALNIMKKHETCERAQGPLVRPLKEFLNLLNKQINIFYNPKHNY